MGQVTGGHLGDDLEWIDDVIVFPKGWRASAGIKCPPVSSKTAREGSAKDCHPGLVRDSRKRYVLLFRQADQEALLQGCDVIEVFQLPLFQLRLMLVRQPDPVRQPDVVADLVPLDGF